MRRTSLAPSLSSKARKASSRGLVTWDWYPRSFFSSALDLPRAGRALEGSPDLFRGISPRFAARFIADSSVWIILYGHDEETGSERTARLCSVRVGCDSDAPSPRPLVGYRTRIIDVWSTSSLSYGGAVAVAASAVEASEGLPWPGASAGPRPFFMSPTSLNGGLAPKVCSALKVSFVR